MFLQFKFVRHLMSDRSALPPKSPGCLGPAPFNLGMRISNFGLKAWQNPKSLGGNKKEGTNKASPFPKDSPKRPNMIGKFFVGEI